MTRTRRLAALAALSLPVILSTAACTPKEVSTSIRAGIPCAVLEASPYPDSDGTYWSSATCSSHSRVDLTQGRVPKQPAPPSAPPAPSVTILDPCDPAIDALPTTEDQSFAGWRPPACFESSEDIAGPGPAPIIGSPGHGG